MLHLASVSCLSIHTANFSKTEEGEVGMGQGLEALLPSSFSLWVFSLRTSWGGRMETIRHLAVHCGAAASEPHPCPLPGV